VSVIPELPELPTFPSGPGLPDQPGVFIPKFLLFLAALGAWRDALNAFSASLDLPGGGSTPSLALAIDTIEDTSYTLGADGWRHKRFTASSAITLNVDATHGLSAGERVRFTQAGAGQVTIVPASAMTLNSRDNALKSTGQFAVWELECVGLEEFDVLGDVTT
jgi:hypothetical protein